MLSVVSPRPKNKMSDQKNLEHLLASLSSQIQKILPEARLIWLISIFCRQGTCCLVIFADCKPYCVLNFSLSHNNPVYESYCQNETFQYHEDAQGAFIYSAFLFQTENGLNFVNCLYGQSLSVLLVYRVSKGFPHYNAKQPWVLPNCPSGPRLLTFYCCQAGN